MTSIGVSFSSLVAWRRIALNVWLFSGITLVEMPSARSLSTSTSSFKDRAITFTAPSSCRRLRRLKIITSAPAQRSPEKIWRTVTLSSRWGDFRTLGRLPGHLLLAERVPYPGYQHGPLHHDEIVGDADQAVALHGADAAARGPDQIEGHLQREEPTVEGLGPQRSAGRQGGQ